MGLNPVFWQTGKLIKEKCHPVFSSIQRMTAKDSWRSLLQSLFLGPGRAYGGSQAAFVLLEPPAEVDTDAPGAIRS